jgi:catechol-2,3-dioxygenase
MIIIHLFKHFRKEMFLEIQQKKEDLYDAISRAHEHLIFNRWNTRLLRELSIQVAPRRYDRNWYDIKHTHI